MEPETDGKPWWVSFDEIIRRSGWTAEELLKKLETEEKTKVG